MRGWSSKAIDWYLRAGKWSQYPSLILAEIIPQLKPQHRVLDIGCGPGLYALALAPLVKEVLALDHWGVVLGVLEEQARQRKLTNIRCLQGTWPDVRLETPVDIVLSAFSGSRVMNSRQSLTKIMSLGADTIYLVAPGTYQPPFAWPHHIGGHSDAGATLALLAQMDIAFTRQDLSLDFGQPVEGWAEAREFLGDFLRIPQAQALEHAKSIGRPHSQGLYLPNPRNVVLIKIS